MLEKEGEAKGGECSKKQIWTVEKEIEFLFRREKGDEGEGMIGIGEDDNNKL